MTVTPGNVMRHGIIGLIKHLPLFLRVAGVASVAMGLLSVAPLFAITTIGPHTTLLLYLSNAGIAAIEFVLASSLGVSWRRFLLSDERPGVLYLGAAFWIYLGRVMLATIAFGLITGIVSMTLVLGMRGQHWITDFISALFPADGQFVYPAVIIQRAIPVAVVLGIGTLPGLWWILRHLPYFTAGIAGNRAISWRKAAVLMRGNMIGFGTGYMALMIPVYTARFLVGSAIVCVLASFPHSVFLIRAIVMQLFMFAWVVVSASMAAFLYKSLVLFKSPQQIT